MDALVPAPLPAPDPLTAIKKLALAAVSSPLTRAMYARALDDFLAWCQEKQASFTRAAVLEYRGHLEAAGLAPSSVNQKLSAIRKLASEAVYAGWLDSAVAQGIKEVKGAKQQGVRAGNWLTKKQAEILINTPDTSTLKGLRDRALLGVLIGCGLRRDEVARLAFDHIQQRDGRWCLVDLRGKGNRIRTVPMPAWAKVAIDHWTAAAEIHGGRIFRGVNKGDRVVGEELSSQGVLRCVEEYAQEISGHIAPHDLRRTYAKLAHKGGAKLDQIQLSLGHSSLVTTQRYFGAHQDLTDAPCDYLHLDLAASA
jgi:site-specific recombinase XerD